MRMFIYGVVLAVTLAGCSRKNATSDPAEVSPGGNTMGDRGGRVDEPTTGRAADDDTTSGSGTISNTGGTGTTGTTATTGASDADTGATADTAQGVTGDALGGTGTTTLSDVVTSQRAAWQGADRGAQSLSGVVDPELGVYVEDRRAPGASKTLTGRWIAHDELSQAFNRTEDPVSLAIITPLRDLFTGFDAGASGTAARIACDETTWSCRSLDGRYYRFAKRTAGAAGTPGMAGDTTGGAAADTTGGAAADTTGGAAADTTGGTGSTGGIGDTRLVGVLLFDANVGMEQSRDWVKAFDRVIDERLRQAGWLPGGGAGTDGEDAR